MFSVSFYPIAFIANFVLARLRLALHRSHIFVKVVTGFGGTVDITLQIV